MPQKSPGPSVKDPEQYEALRDQGASKEKAARIANSDRHATAEKGGRAPSYEQWRKEDLEKRAAEIGIDGRSTMSKDELIDALRNH
ncbi:MAG TPA: Rho termination factor [Solirubrobacter sp.]